jgi:hypothetical protein
MSQTLEKIMKVKTLIRDHLPTGITDDTELILQHLKPLLNALLQDVKDIGKMRNAKTAQSLVSIINEVNNKWIKICESERGKEYFLKTGGFLDIIKLKMPEAYSAYQIVNGKSKSRAI